MITSLVTVVHVFVCILLVLIVLLQHGKGADMGATFGGGSQTLFGAAGADNLLTRITTALAAIFMITSVILASHANEKRNENSGSLFQNTPQNGTPGAPNTPQTNEHDNAAQKNTDEVAIPPSATPAPAPAGAPVAPEAPQAAPAPAPVNPAPAH